MEKAQAAGSIWNVNSWHWEMKNYTAPAKKILEQHILDLVLQPSPDLKIIHKAVKFTKSDCEVNVRKGKQYLIYDFELDLEVEGKSGGRQANTSPRTTPTAATRSRKCSATTSTTWSLTT